MHWEEFLIDLIRHYGYWILFLGTLLEGETIVIIAGFFARSGYLDLGWVMTVSLVGTMLADQTLFHLGRIYGPAALERRPTLRKLVHKAWRLLGRLQDTFIFGYRFLYGLRVVSPLALGAAGVPTLRFLILNGIGAVVWAITFPLIGYSIGVALETLVTRVKQYEIIVTIIMLVLAAIGAVAYWYHMKKVPNGENGEEESSEEVASLAGENASPAQDSASELFDSDQRRSTLTAEAAGEETVIHSEPPASSVPPPNSTSDETASRQPR